MNPSRGHRDKDFAALDELIKEITVNAYGNDKNHGPFGKLSRTVSLCRPTDSSTKACFS